MLYTPVTIGSDNGSYAFTGELDEVAFFTGTLTAAQVQAEYAARTSASSYSSVVLSQNPVAYYRLGEAAGGTVAYDSSGKFDNASFGTGVTPGVAGNPPGDTAYQFTAGTDLRRRAQIDGFVGPVRAIDRRRQHDDRRRSRATRYPSRARQHRRSSTASRSTSPRI